MATVYRASLWTDQLGHNLQVVGAWSGATYEVARGVPGEKGSSLFWTHNGVLMGGVLFDNGRDRRFLEALVESKANVPVQTQANASFSLPFRIASLVVLSTLTTGPNFRDHLYSGRSSMSPPRGSKR
ncbi:oxidoreductase C-terminal domain-containing protein [Roseovarius sp. SYSU LYC5161]|uniref:oxidoreductase C-terminal domain-containing protein n=1 Tax=Roseovarius halophilus (ex Wu et al. 2025) TaxID=3376060 RepID=UPI00399A7E82